MVIGRGVIGQCNVVSGGRVYPRSVMISAMSKLHQDLGHRDFVIGDFVWVTDPKMRPFLRGFIVAIDDYQERCTIVLDGAPKVFSQIGGGRWRVSCSKLVAPSLLDRLAFEGETGRSPKHQPWPSKHRLRMSI